MKRGIDYIGVGIGAVIINPEGKVLLAKRGPKAKNERGKWEFPGGSVEFGDTMEDTIIREMKEELGVEIKTLKHLSPVDHIIPHEKQHWVTSGFIAKIVKGKPKIMEPNKCEKIDWFSLKELEELVSELSIPTRKYLPQLKKINLKDFI